MHIAPSLQWLMKLTIFSIQAIWVWFISATVVPKLTIWRCSWPERTLDILILSVSYFNLSYWTTDFIRSMCLTNIHLREIYHNKSLYLLFIFFYRFILIWINLITKCHNYVSSRQFCKVPQWRKRFWFTNDFKRFENYNLEAYIIK